MNQYQVYIRINHVISLCVIVQTICAHPADCQNRVADVEATVTISIGPTAWCIGRMAIFVAAKLCEIRITLFTPQPSGHHGIVATRVGGRQGRQSLVNALTSVNLHGSFSNLARTFVAPDLGRVWFASLSMSIMHNALMNLSISDEIIMADMNTKYIFVCTN